MLVNYLASVLYGQNEDSAKDLCGKIDEKIESYANGDLDHAANAMALLWERSKEGESFRAPRYEMLYVSSPTSPFPATNLGACL